MHKQDNYTFLTTAPIRRVIPAMAVPTVISMLVTSIYNLVDTYFVGLLNTFPFEIAFNLVILNGIFIHPRNIL